MKPTSPVYVCAACGGNNSFFNLMCVHCDQPLTSSPAVLSDLYQQPDSTDQHPVPGDKDGPWQRFEMREVLASGGMGTVYRAHDPRLNRPVAIKVLHPGTVGNPREQLLQEARKASLISHRNLVTIYEMVLDANPPFLVMELIDGLPLSEHLVGGPFEVDQALTIADQIAAALIAIHQLDLAHLDLKPANVMLTRQGEVRLLDFGLARVLTTQPSKRDTVAVAGTWGYFSPEQSLGDTGDQSADIFAFGVLFYEMLTGNPPFRRESPEASLAALRRGTFAPLPVQTTQDTALNTILKKCLEPRRSSRFKEMASVAKALQRVQQSMPIATSMDGEATAIFKPSTTSSTTKTWLALVLFTVVSVFFGTRYWPWGKITTAPHFSPQQTQRLLMVPFLNLAGTPRGQILTDGLQQTLTQALLEHYDTGNWWLLPASEIRQHHNLSPSQARDLYGADYLIEGNLSEQGPVLRLNLSLVDTHQNRVMIAQTVETTDGGLLAIQLQAMQALAEILQLKPRNDEKLAALTWELPRRQAHEAFIRGTGLLYRYDESQNLEAAISNFEQAIELDATYAPPYQGLAEALIHLWRKFHQKPDLAKAQMHSLKASQLNPAWAAAWHTRGNVASLRGQVDEALQFYEKALHLDPKAANTLSELGKLHQRLNQPQKAEAFHQKALALQPHSWILHNRLGIFFTGKARYAEAEKAFRQVVHMVPDNLLAYQNLAAVLHLQGQPTEALKAIQAALLQGQTPNLYSNLGTILFYVGRYNEASEAFAQAVALNERHYLFWGNLADAQRWTPDREKEALASYQRAIALLEALLNQRPDDSQAVANLALYLAKSGQTELALSRLKTILPSNDGFLCYAAATVYELADLRKPALESIQCALSAGYSFQEIDHDPELSKLREDALFLKMRSN